MKTNHDLLEEFTRYVLESSGMPESEVELRMHHYRTQLMPNMKKKPAEVLTDSEYSEKFEQMKAEAPAYMHFLLTTEFPELPGKFRGESN